VISCRHKRMINYRRDPIMLAFPRPTRAYHWSKVTLNTTDDRGPGVALLLLAGAERCGENNRAVQIRISMQTVPEVPDTASDKVVCQTDRPIHGQTATQLQTSTKGTLYTSAGTWHNVTGRGDSLSPLDSNARDSSNSTTHNSPSSDTRD